MTSDDAARLDPELLRRLCACHAAPGDEEEVFALLEQVWIDFGWQVTRHGPYALSARVGRLSRKPVLLVTAHADSPGYTLDLPPPAKVSPRAKTIALHAVDLGRPGFTGASAAALLKTRTGRWPVTLRPDPRDERAVRVSLAASLLADAAPEPGDRICFAPEFSLTDSVVRSPFLDNRLGCWLLAALAGCAAAWTSRYDIVLGVTGTEEMGGFGAAVLARAVQPDLVVAVDATYEATRQQVFLGAGPVLTLSDASVLLAPALRDRVRALFAGAGLPLQTEVYNFSGTDARAFPHQGLPAVVLPLLLPTRGNHSPGETGDIRDAATLLAGIRRLAEMGI